MKVHSLHITGFGRFDTPTTFEFDPHGLTVVYGDNERGKTTIKDAICATFFGFQTTDEKTRYRPWNASQYITKVTFSSKGSHYCIERDFDTEQVTVWNISEDEMIFQDVANPRGWGAAQEAYSDFIREKIGFSSPDIFRLTTLVEQMKTRTKISEKIRQLISGSEKADYARIVETLESELENITRDVPWKNLRKDRKIEEIKEQIAALSKSIEDAQHALVTSCRLQAEIQTLEEELAELKNKSETKKEGLRALETYIQVGKDVKNIQKSLKLLQEQSETIQEISQKIEVRMRSDSWGKILPVAVGAAGVSISAVLWLLEGSLPLVIGVMALAGVLSGASYYYYNMLSSQISPLKDMKIPERKETISKERERLHKELFELTSLREGAHTKYPSFANEDSESLFTLQENMRQDQHVLESRIKQDEETLYNLKVRLESHQQNAISFHSLEQERGILKENLAYLEKRRKGLLTAISELEECITEYQDKYIKELGDYITGAFRKITSGRYTSVHLEQSSLEPVVSTDSHPSIHKESLSVGALEQLYFAMRLSMAYLLSRQIRLPFLLDDSFVSYDGHRLENVHYILSKIKRTNQIILFVHDFEYTKWADAVINLNKGD